jgi:hypothetical protein
MENNEMKKASFLPLAVVASLILLGCEIPVAGAPGGLGPVAVNLHTAGDFVILAKTAISTIPTSAITGNVGISPAAESDMTGFSQTKDTGFSTAPQVTGFLYAADSTDPTPAKMLTAVSDMEAAYTDAATRPAASGANLDLAAGLLGGKTVSPGLYTWNTGVDMTSNVTLAGSGASADTWIFQINGNLTLAAAKQVLLTAGAKAKNIFWQVTGTVTIAAGAHFEGIILGKTTITLETGATMNGRALAQTAVALDSATLTAP